MLEKSYYDKADTIIEFYGRKASSLIPIMQDIQAEYRYLPGELLTYVAQEIGVKEARTSPLNQKESTLSKSATELPVMSVNPCPFWRRFRRSWD